VAARLIIVDANDTSNFTFTDFDTGADASNYFMAKGDRLAWIVFRAAGLIGYRIDFNKDGTPFGAASIVVPNGGLSPQQTVIDTALTHGYGYTVTLSNLWQDDPQVEPYDSIQIMRTLHLDSPVIVPINVSIVNGALQIDKPGPYAALSFVYWQGNPLDPTLRVDFSQSGKIPPSPFVDRSGDASPLGYRTNGTTFSQQVRSNISGSSYNYTISMAGMTKQFVFTVQ
jgi:hypothetical protein